MNIEGKHIHFIGIGGTGMSGIASILLDLGYSISGSDLQSTIVTKRLTSKGAMIYKGHDGSHISGANLVVISSAINEENQEVIEAKKKKIEIIPRAEMLSRIMHQNHRIAVAGTHGKTTTTSMISLILEKMNLDPTIAIGGEVNDIGGNAKLGKGDYVVVEADESDGSFLLLNPNIAIVTNIENDHLDYYNSIGKTIESFERFINKVPENGCVIYGNDCPNARQIVKKHLSSQQIISYGFHSDSQIRAMNCILDKNTSTSEIYYKKEKLGSLKLNIPGYHNISNAMAAIATGIKLDIKFNNIKEILFHFRGVKRRQEIIADYEGKLMIIDDYAHHPSEIKATLEAIRKGWPNRRIIAVFQPHRYSRTKFLLEEFGNAFYNADIVVVNDIYSANEKPLPGISAELVYQKIKDYKKEKVFYCPEKEKAISFLEDIVADGDIVMTLGAGDVWKIGKEFAKKTKQNEPKVGITN